LSLLLVFLSIKRRMFSARVIVNRSFGAIRSFSAQPNYNMIQTEVKGKVGVIRLHRPKALNALCNELIGEVLEAGRAFDKDPNIGCIIITGNSFDSF
jgi:1,4-dihydroxy-2-naphthoyl-CoA synthase